MAVNVNPWLLALPPPPSVGEGWGEGDHAPQAPFFKVSLRDHDWHPLLNPLPSRERRCSRPAPEEHL